MWMFEYFFNFVMMFFMCVWECGDVLFFWVKIDGIWVVNSWVDVVCQVVSFVVGLKVIGLKCGDWVMLIVENCFEWVIFDFVIMVVGCVMVLIYVINIECDYFYIIENLGVCVIIVLLVKFVKMLMFVVL